MCEGKREMKRIGNAGSTKFQTRGCEKAERCSNRKSGRTRDFGEKRMNKNKKVRKK